MVGALLHQPRRSSVAEGVPHDVITKSCVFQNALSRRTDLAGERLAIVHAVDDEADFLARA